VAAATRRIFLVKLLEDWYENLIRSATIIVLV